MQKQSCLTSLDRLVFWDNIKGFLIILVVFGHCLWDLQYSPTIKLVVAAIYYFHMPVFIFISGYFSKSQHSRSKIVLVRLLVAYFLMWLVWAFVDMYNGVSPHWLTPYKSEWYVFSLVVWRLITPSISKVRHIVAITIVFSILIGFSAELGGNLTMSLCKITTFLPFFVLGYLSSAEVIDNIRENRKIGYFSLILAIIVFVVSYKFLNAYNRILLPDAYTDCGDTLLRVSMFLVSILMLLFLVSVSSNQYGALTRIGQNSFIVYLLHRPITYLLGKMISPAPAVVQIVLAFVLTIGIVRVCSSQGVVDFTNYVLDYCVDVVTLKRRGIFVWLFVVIFLWSILLY